MKSRNIPSLEFINPSRTDRMKRAAITVGLLLELVICLGLMNWVFAIIGGGVADAVVVYEASHPGGSFCEPQTSRKESK
jgi:hypothetical protein